MSVREHTDKNYEEQLQKLRERLLFMGARVEEMITLSIKALVERDNEYAKIVLATEPKVDSLEVELDESCISILALRQPVASDLRYITMVMKMVRDLERIADIAVNIVERVIELNEDDQLKPYVDIPKMAEAVRAMVRDALDAMVKDDAVLAESIIDKDEIIDDYHMQIFRELLTYMMEDSRTISRAIRIMSIAKHLERIGDHASNLAEMVYYNVRGKDIRHTRHGASQRDG